MIPPYCSSTKNNFSLKFYGDPAGYPTVGWGHLITRTKTYTKNTSGNPKTSLLTQAEANALSSSLNLGYTSPISQSKAKTFLLRILQRL
ncbi:glycoside hydrolase family protein [Paenibacillus riograndensis]|uniref:glycoside hydrolase family protein n=1 Tax=Paenibacillus riograndensis TaxID=483937 RepID=UPI003F4918E7